MNRSIASHGTVYSDALVFVQNQTSAISQFDNSDYDALWDGVTGDIMHKPNGDIPRDLSHNFELSNWLIVAPDNGIVMLLFIK